MSEMETSNQIEEPPFKHIAATGLGMAGFGCAWLLPYSTQTDVRAKELVFQRLNEVLAVGIDPLFNAVMFLLIGGGLIFTLMGAVTYMGSQEDEPNHRGAPTAAPISVAIFEGIWPILFAFPPVMAAGMVYLTLNSLLMAGIFGGVAVGLILPQGIEMHRMTRGARTVVESTGQNRNRY